jgi:hypothetical protein
MAVRILQHKHRGIRTELLFKEQYVAAAAPTWRQADGRSGRTLTARQLSEAAFVVASPTATFHGSVEQMLTRMKLQDRIVLRARHFGGLPELAMSSDLLSIVPAMFANNQQPFQITSTAASTRSTQRRQSFQPKAKRSCRWLLHPR